MVGFLQAGTGAVARTSLDKLRESVSVKDFGAVGDGTTDDTAAIQAAVNYCIPNQRRLYVPAGNYKTTASITHNLQSGSLYLFGDGNQASVFVAVIPGGAPTFQFGLDGTYTSNELVITEIGVNNYSNASDAFRCYSIGHIDVSRNSVVGGKRGIYAKAGFVCNILENFISNTSGSAVTLDASAANASRVSFNDLFGCGNGDNAAAILISAGDNPVVEGNDIEGCYGGVQFTSVNCGRIISNYIEGGTYPFYFAGGTQAVTIEGNWFGAASGGTTMENCRNILVKMNAFYNCNLSINGATASDIEVGYNNITGTSTIAKSSWTTPTLLNSWTNNGGSYQTAGYRKDTNNVIHLRGQLTGGTTGSTVFTLPLGYSPPATQRYFCSSTSGGCEISITSSGSVVATVAAGGNQIGLNGISFAL